jgi:hypothetical protein
MSRLADDETVLVKAYAVQLWQGLSKNEQSLIRFGMFPADKMDQAERDGIAGRDAQHALVCALMDCAKADGGMRA